MEPRYILGADIGSSTIKCKVYDEKVNIVGEATTETQVLYPKPGYIELDPDFIWETFQEIVKQAVKNANVQWHQIAGIGLSAQRGTFITWDKNSGEPFHNFIAWNDLRADELVKSWDNSYSLQGLRIGSKLLYLVTRRSRFLGASVLRIHNKHISMRLLWVLQNNPNLREKCKRGEVLFGTIDTWLVWRLTEAKTHVTDYSMASSSALYDPYIKEWAGWAFGLFNIPMNIMPEVIDTSGKLGNCLQSIFGTPLPILAMAGDQQAATFGHCCFDAGDMKCTLGTGAFFDINTGSKPHTSMAGLYPLIGWKYGSVTSFLAEGSSNDTGVVVKWAETVGLINNPSESETAAESVNNSNGVYFIPGFSGLQAPINNDLACAGIIGIKYNTKREEIVRALLESLAFRVKQLFDTIKCEVDFPLNDIRVDGGVAQNNFLMQLIADLTGKTVDRATHADMSCLGVALFSGLAAGVWKDEAELKSLRMSQRIFKAKPLSADLQTSLSEWTRAMQRCLDWYTTDVQFM